MTQYHVTTENRTYNSINSREHLNTVMGNLGDTSKVLAVSVWQDGSGWTKISLADMR